MANFLYTVIIFPLYQIIEIVYKIFFEICKNVGVSVIGVSVAVTLLCLPLYAVAEKWQEDERKKRMALQPWTDHIKKAFKGDEQYMILSTYYRQNDYHPLMALRSSFGLLIQIPFFIAAYSFLSNNSDLLGKSFLFIKDMGMPDGLLQIGSLKLNLLPILMTVINIASGVIYTRGFQLKDKIQLYGMALLFLVILYASPSGLVLYWTMNNVFSLVKNIFYKMKNPLKVFFICCVATVFFVQAFIVIKIGIPSKSMLLALVGMSIVYFIPLILKLLKKITSSLTIFDNDSRTLNTLFIVSAITSCLFGGVVIVSNAISTSVTEFSFLLPIENPIQIVRQSFFVALGFCVFWPMCIFFLFNKDVKKLMAVGSFAFLICAICNTFIFNTYPGLTLNPLFLFTTFPEFKAGINTVTLRELINLLLNLSIIMGGFFFIKKNAKIPALIVVAICLAFSFIGIKNAVTINSKFSEYAKVYNPEKAKSAEPIFHFSKNEKNVVVLMLDRAVSSFIEPIFEEDSSIKEEFNGFTLYRNCASHCGMTLFSTPAMWGGAEYLPPAMNARKDELLIDKHNESLKVLPKIFTDNSYDVTVVDSSWGNYLYDSDVNFFKGMEGVSAYHLKEKYSQLWYNEHGLGAIMNSDSATTLRNAPFYAFMLQLPTFLQQIVYRRSYWNDGFSSTNALVRDFAVLYYLDDLTDSQESKGQAFFLTNDTTHSTTILEDGYKIGAYQLDVFSPEDTAKGTWDMNMISIKAVSEWLHKLKEMGVYDNTRIIIVSDHGPSYSLPGFVENQTVASLSANALFMVKDFGAKEGFNVDDITFVALSDLPHIVTKGIISTPLVNPYTKNLIPVRTKDEIVNYSGPWHPEEQGSLFEFTIHDATLIRDTVLDTKNWIFHYEEK